MLRFDAVISRAIEDQEQWHTLHWRDAFGDIRAPALQGQQAFPGLTGRWGRETCEDVRAGVLVVWGSIV